jgi:hypothetical protein
MWQKSWYSTLICAGARKPNSISSSMIPYSLPSTSSFTRENRGMPCSRKSCATLHPRTRTALRRGPHRVVWASGLL